MLGTGASALAVITEGVELVGVGVLLTYLEAAETQPSELEEAEPPTAESSRELNRTRCASAKFVVPQAANQAAQNNRRHQEKAFTATPYNEMFRAKIGKTRLNSRTERNQ